MRGKTEYSFRFLTIGITAFILGVILLIASVMTDLSISSGLFLVIVGAIVSMIGLVVRNIWETNR